MCTFNNGNTTHSPASNEDNDNNIHHLYQGKTKICILTDSSQEDVDEECNHLNPMTNQRIDNLTFNRLDARDSPTESDLLDMGMTHVHSDSLIQRFMAQRNAPSNDRITHPSDTFIGFLVNLLRALIMCCFDNIRYGIQDSQPHSLVLPIRIITFREAIIIYDENNAMNIDATLPNSTIEDENMHSTIDLTWHDTTITRESIGEEEIGESTNEAEENDDYSDVGDDQEEMMEYNHTINREHRDNLPNENNAEGEASPPTKNSNVNKIPSHSTSHMPSAVLTSRSSSMNESSEQVEEIVPALATPTDNDTHVLSTDTNESELNAGIRKHDRPFDGNTKRGEERPV
ncbi:unnamed protein product [Rotaria magnacalcarata]|uniref:Uncharacterized protein n=1 Tax=Rotaria magnacalcarata TaxID=392030 RepID=A0A816TCN9_9BILA|nr:unnamed protein product [Rotaria magnacalcarata]